MNNVDRDRLVRFQLILDSIPFSASGTATTTGYGSIMFEQDMRAIRPYLRKVLEGMVLQGSPCLEEGNDYENPDELLSKIEAWVEKRKVEGWQDASQYSFAAFLKEFQA